MYYLTTIPLFISIVTASVCDVLEGYKGQKYQLNACCDPSTPECVQLGRKFYGNTTINFAICANSFKIDNQTFMLTINNTGAAKTTDISYEVYPNLTPNIRTITTINGGYSHSHMQQQSNSEGGRATLLYKFEWNGDMVSFEINIQCAPYKLTPALVCERLNCTIYFWKHICPCFMMGENVC